MERVLQLTHDLQQRILSQVMPHLPSYDFSAIMNSARDVGGDFVPLGQDDIDIVVGDVSDQGMLAVILKALLRSLVWTKASRGVFLAQVLHPFNQHLIDISESGMIVILLYGIFHGRSGEFLYACASHELPLILDNDRQAIATSQGIDQLLGLFLSPDLDEQTIDIPQGGKLILHTNDVTDGIHPTFRTRWGDRSE